MLRMVLSILMVSIIFVGYNFADEDSSQVDMPKWQIEMIQKLATTKVTFEFDEARLKDVLAFLQVRTGLNIILDPSANPNGVVNLQVNDMKLFNAIKWILKMQGLTFIMKDEAILVGKKKALQGPEVTRIYDIKDLAYQPTDFIPPPLGKDTENANGGEEEPREESSEAIARAIEKIIENEKKKEED